LRQATVPEEVGEVQKRVKFITIGWKRPSQSRIRKGAVSIQKKSARKKENPARIARTLQIGRRLDGHRDAEDIEEVVSRWTGIGVTSIKEDEQQKLLRIEPEFAQARHKPGQGHHRAGPRDSPQPAPASNHRCAPWVASSFLGRPAVGKTEVARRLAEFLFGSESRWFASICRSHGETLRLEADWRASRVRGLTKKAAINGNASAGRLTRSSCSMKSRKAHPDVFKYIVAGYLKTAS